MANTCTLEFHIKAKAESQDMFSLEVFLRDSSQPLANSSFEYDVSFLTAYDVSNLEPGRSEAETRFEKLKMFGSDLYNRVFTKEIGDLWQKFKEKEEFVTLCIRISREAERLELLPWETLFDGQEFIAAGVRTGLTRLPLDVSIKRDLPVLSYPLKMLALLSSPLDLGDNERLEIETEQEILLRGVNAPAGQGRLLLEFEDEAKLSIIENALETPYPLFHFSGHGIDPKSGGGLLLEDMGGKKRFTPVAEVMETLEKGIRHFRLAVIAGCQTARTLYAPGFQDLARALVRKGVPGVLAMQFSITDRGGLLLAEHLYPKLAEGQPVDKVLSVVRRMMLQGDEADIRGDAFAMVLFLGGEDILRAREMVKKAAEREIRIEFDKLTTLPELRFGFYGRRKEYRLIRDGILYKHERAVIVHGIGGIGKTALIQHVASRLQGNFDGVCVFDCRGGALSPDVVLLKIHRLLEGKGIKVLEQLMHRFFPAEELGAYVGQVLSQVSLLVIFDNFETQLSEVLGSQETLFQKGFLPPEAKEKKVGHIIRDQNLKTFLEVLVRTTAERSCFLFTSRYWFDIDERRVGPIRYMALNDLSRPEALGLMQHLPFLSAASYGDKMEAYGVFGGHPYGLVTLDRHCGMRSLVEVLGDARGVHLELREFLAIEMNYGKLTPGGRELLNRLAAFRQPVEWDAVNWVLGTAMDTTEAVVGEFMKLMKNIDRDEIPEKLRQMDEAALAQMFKEMLPEQREAEGMEPVVQELVGWGMVIPVREEEEVFLTVHSLVREFCREKSGEEWKKHLIEAVGYYTNKYKLYKEEQKTLATVLEEVEAAELLMEAGDGEAAADVIMDIDPLLNRWGWGRLLESLYEQVLRMQPGVEKKTMAMILHNLAILEQNRGDYAAALEKYEQSLKILDELGDRARVAKSLHNIGAIYQDKSDYGAALDKYESARQVFEEIGDRKNDAAVMHQVGMIYQMKGDYGAAMEKYEQSLKIKEELGDKLGIAKSLHQVGMIYQMKGDYAAALEKYESARQVFEEIGDRKSATTNLHQVGNIYYLKGDYNAALEKYESARQVFDEIGDRKSAAATLHNIGAIYQDKGDYGAALEKYEQSLKILEELGDRAGVAISLHQVGNIYYLKGEYKAALKKYELSLKITEELGDRAGVARSLHQVGNIYYLKGDYAAALEKYEQSLKILEELGDQAGVAISLHQVGVIYQMKGDYAAALEKYEQSLKISEEIGDKLGIAQSLHQIGMIYHLQKKYPEAFEYLLNALGIFTELESPDAKKTIGNLNKLRDEWGEDAFDSAMSRVQGSGDRG